MTTIYIPCFCELYFFSTSYSFLKEKNQHLKILCSLVFSRSLKFISSVLSNLKVDTLLLSLWCAYWDKDNPTLVLWIKIQPISSAYLLRSVSKIMKTLNDRSKKKITIKNNLLTKIYPKVLFAGCWTLFKPHTGEVYKAPESSAVKHSPKTLLVKIHQSGASRDSLWLKMCLEAETLQKLCIFLYTSLHHVSMRSLVMLRFGKCFPPVLSAWLLGQTDVFSFLHLWMISLGSSWGMQVTKKWLCSVL